MEEISNVDIALYALHKLDGATTPVHTEEVGLECFRLVPERFSWKKYPKYPELEPARCALQDAAKPAYGKLARKVSKKIAGKRQSHWILTPAGLAYIRERLEILRRLEAGRTLAGSEHREEDRFIAQIEKHVAFKKFSATGSCEDIAKYEFTDLLHCSLDASPNVLRDRLERLQTRAEKAEAARVKRFLASCEDHFRDMLVE